MNDWSALSTVGTYILTFVIGQLTGFILARLVRFTGENKGDQR